MTRRVGPFDAALAVAAIGAIELTCWLSGGSTIHDRIVTAIAAVPFGAPVAMRRIWPGPALVVSAAVVPVSTWLGGLLLSNDNAYMVPVLILAYSAGAWLAWRPSAVAAALALALLWLWAFVPAPGTSNTVADDAQAAFFVSVLVVPLWLVGRLTQRQRTRTAAFGALASEASAVQAAEHIAAVAAERARIGTELEDVIAHGLSAMVVQAGRARLLLKSDPDQARQAIISVEDTGRDALDDLRRLLGLLRKDHEPAALGPQPGLGEITTLVTLMGARGLACDHRLSGEPTELSPGVDLVAYRIVETCLGTAAAHGGRQATVTLCFKPPGLSIEVTTDRPVEQVADGLGPLESRVALYDGNLRVVATPGGSMVVARIPLASGVRA